MDNYFSPIGISCDGIFDLLADFYWAQGLEWSLMKVLIIAYARQYR